MPRSPSYVGTISYSTERLFPAGQRLLEDGEGNILIENAGEAEGYSRPVDVAFNKHFASGKYSYHISFRTPDLKRHKLPAGAEVHCLEDSIEETRRLVKEWFPKARFFRTGTFYKAGDEPRKAILLPSRNENKISPQVPPKPAVDKTVLGCLLFLFYGVLLPAVIGLIYLIGRWVWRGNNEI